MRVRDLRIGNWVANNDGFPVMVLIIDRAMVLVDSSRDPKCFNTNNVHVSTLQGILLTPNVLDQAGGVRIAEFFSIISYTFPGFKSCWYNAEMKHFVFDFGAHYAAVHHLHELQNLYFALTSEELKIQLYTPTHK